MPPTDYRIIDKAVLRRKYFDEDWPAKLAEYRSEPPRQYGNHKTVQTWWNGTELMAEIREYTNPGEGTDQLVVCQLRDGDILYYIK